MYRKHEFLTRCLERYGYRDTPGGFIDQWRPAELPGLQLPLTASCQHDKITETEIYLDYAGSALPTKTQLSQIFAHSSSHRVLGNPHSGGPAASRSLVAIEEAKQRVLKHLDATPGRFASLKDPPVFASLTERHVGYDILFTSGATEGLRLIAERFRWKGPCSSCQRQSIFFYAQNSHTSVVGMRNLAIKQGGRFVCRSWETISSMGADDFDQLVRPSGDQCTNCKMDEYPNLLAIPAECNFGGIRLDVAAIIQAARSAKTPWFSVVDIAKAASTSPVSLKQMDADFSVLSFYKLFGEPTGLGALIVKQSSINLVKGQGYYQGGGSVDIMLTNQNFCVTRSTGLNSLANGSVNFRGIQSLVYGFDELGRRGGMHRIHQHATCLARELTRRLETLQHGNGQRAIVLMGAWADPSQCDTAGPTVTLNILRDDGSFVGYNEVSKVASLYHPPIQFRTGCFCNPGACQDALKLNDDEVLENFHRTGHVCGDHIDLVEGKPTGAIRISFGKDSIWEDMDSFVTFVQNTFIDGSRSSSAAKSPNDQTKVEVTELYLFPIKSCAGQRVRRWKIEMPTGKLKHDREFSLVDTSGTAIRLQACPKMTTIKPTIDLETETMKICAPGMRDLIIQIGSKAQVCHNGNNAIKVCGNTCGGRLWGDHGVSDWFSDYLGLQCWLARFNPDGSFQLPHHEIHSSFVPRDGFANEQPLLLISENAVSLLNDVLKDQNQRPVGSRHFRPNMVVRVIGANDDHVEDQWDFITVTRNGLSFETKGSCARCAMVDFDPCSGKKGKTLRALAVYRRRKGQINFGVFLKAIETSGGDCQIGWIEEGDEILCR